MFERSKEIKPIVKPNQLRRLKKLNLREIMDVELQSIIDVLEGHDYELGIKKRELYFRDVALPDSDWEITNFPYIVDFAYSLIADLLEHTDSLLDFHYYLSVKIQHSNIEHIYNYFLKEAS